jgi:hypothetical protein
MICSPEALFDAMGDMQHLVKSYGADPTAFCSDMFELRHDLIHHVVVTVNPSILPIAPLFEQKRVAIFLRPFVNLCCVCDAVP